MNERNESLDTTPFLYELRDLHQRRGELAEAVAVMLTALDLLAQAGDERGIGEVENWLRTVDQPRLTRMALERQIRAPLVDQVLSGRLALPKPRRQELVVLFSDMSGFTAMTEEAAPEEVVDLLNEWFDEATRAVRRHGGIVDKFIGDAVMALFGVPDEDPNAAANAVRAALDMRDSIAAMNLRHQALGGRTFRVGIGIAAGEAVVGFVGSHLRHSFTAIGDTVNTASRLESETRNHPGCDLLITEAVEVAQSEQSVAETSFLCHAELKGKREPVAVYRVLGSRG